MGVHEPPPLGTPHRNARISRHGQAPLISHRTIVVPSTPDAPVRATDVRALVARGLRVLVLGAEWTPESIRRVLEAGASGCILNSLDANGLAAAITAAAAGHLVISPELGPTYLSAMGGDQPPGRPPSPRARDLVEKLTSREIEILGMLGEGLATNEIAKRLYVSAATVKSHVSHAMAKLAVRNRVQAALLVKELGLVELAGDRGSRGTSPQPEPDQAGLPERAFPANL